MFSVQRLHEIAKICAPLAAQTHNECGDTCELIHQVISNTEFDPDEDTLRYDLVEVEVQTPNELSHIIDQHIYVCIDVDIGCTFDHIFFLFQTSQGLYIVDSYVDDRACTALD